MKEYVDEFNVKCKDKYYKIVKESKFTYLTVKSLYRENSQRYVVCECKCGKKNITLNVKSVVSGNTKSCGCYNRELCVSRNFKHGNSTRGNKTTLYKIWTEMRRRCYTSSCKSYKDYGGRGITVCKDWEDFEIFKLWAEANNYKEGLSIERINTNGNYEPSNCIWITKSQQSRNRRTSHFITYDNKTLTLTEWSKELGISRTTLYKRLNKGLDIKDVLKA